MFGSAPVPYRLAASGVTAGLHAFLADTARDAEAAATPAGRCAVRRIRSARRRRCRLPLQVCRPTLCSAGGRGATPAGTVMASARLSGGDFAPGATAPDGFFGGCA